MGFFFGLCGWFSILYEIFSGDASKAAGKNPNQYVAESYATMRCIVTVGWAIYPAGYF